MTEQPLNQPAEIPPELDRWNWGAFLLHWIWGIGNRTYIALLMFVPLVNIVVMFVLGARGSRWAWRNRAWRDAAHFRKVQRNWAIAGLVVWIGTIGIVVAAIGSVPFAIRSSEPYRIAMEQVAADQTVAAAIGSDVGSGFWTMGSINVQAGGTGEANLSIPVHGDKGAGTAVVRAVRNGGQWTIRLLVVKVDGQDAPIVLVNADNLSIPDAAVGI